MNCAALRQRYGRRERAIEQTLQVERPIPRRIMRDVAIRKRPAQFEQRAGVIDQHPVRAPRQPRLQRTRETRWRVKPRRRVERGGVGGEPLGIRDADARRQQRPLAALRLAPDLDEYPRALVRRVATDRQKSGPLLADIDQRRVETGGEAHDPAEMQAAGGVDVAALDMQFGRCPVFDPDGAPLAGAASDQQLSGHRTTYPRPASSCAVS